MPAKTKVEKTTGVSIRDSRGLINNLDYVYSKNGFVDWRAMVNSDFIVMNKDAAKKAGFDLETASDEDKRAKMLEWNDDKKIILLGGLRDLAKIRGFLKVDQEVKRTDGIATAVCSITWIPNFETDYKEVTYTAVGSATDQTIPFPYSQYLESIASNRAFCRAVREYLGILVVSDEELNPSGEDVKVKGGDADPWASIKSKCENKGIDFPTLKTWMEGHGMSIPSSCNSIESIPQNMIFNVLNLIKEETKGK